MLDSVWDKCVAAGSDKIIPYAELPQISDPAMLDKLVVLKLNGGLGTTMGMGGLPKSAIDVREGMTFLDICVRQIEVCDF